LRSHKRHILNSIQSQMNPVDLYLETYACFSQVVPSRPFPSRPAFRPKFNVNLSSQIRNTGLSKYLNFGQVTLINQNSVSYVQVTET
jgi:hypothetical protein